jgi:hypothetical protein
MPEDMDGSANGSDDLLANGESFAGRCQQAMLAIANTEASRKGAAELQAIKAACIRAEQAASNLQNTKAVRSQLIELELQPAVPAPRKNDALAKARRNLRTTATLAGEPGNDLTDRLQGSAVQDALKAAELVLKAAEGALFDTADAERVRLRPSDLDAQVVSLPGAESASITVNRIRTSFSDRFRSQNVSALPDAVRAWRTDAAEWSRLKESAREAIEQLHPEIQVFVEAAATQAGATWAHVTPTVRMWLDNEANGESYKVQKW